MENNQELSIASHFAISYERFIKGYQQYKAQGIQYYPHEEVERYDDNSRVEQA